MSIRPDQTLQTAGDNAITSAGRDAYQNSASAQILNSIDMRDYRTVGSNADATLPAAFGSFRIAEANTNSSDTAQGQVNSSDAAQTLSDSKPPKGVTIRVGEYSECGPIVFKPDEHGGANITVHPPKNRSCEIEIIDPNKRAEPKSLD